MKVNMTPNPLDVVTIHASQGDTEARQWEFELHNNGELIDTSDITEQMFFKAYKGGTEQLLPENGSTPTTSPFKGDIKYPQGLLTDQEFTYRQSPTESDGLAKITDIKGNTLVWNQLVQNGNFANGVGRWTAGGSNTLSVTDGVCKIQSKNTSVNNHQIVFPDPSIFQNNHTYLVGVSARAYGNYIGGNLYMAQQTNIIAIGTLIDAMSSSWQRGWLLFNRNDMTLTNGKRLALGGLSTVTTDDYFEVKDIVVFDLTQMGLDITDPSDFTSLFSLPYYDYNQGTLLSFNGNGIKTVSKNQFDTQVVTTSYAGLVLTKTQETIRAVYSGGSQYAGFNFYGSPVFTDTFLKGRYRLSFDVSGLDTQWTVGLRQGASFLGGGQAVAISNDGHYSFTIDTEANPNCYLSFSRTGNKTTAYDVTFSNIQLELGTTETSYTPFEEKTISLPISQYFPTGMKSAGTVYDELTPRKAITRIGAVDLGSLNWSYTSTTGHLNFNTTDINTLAKKSSTATAYANIVCSKYGVISENDAYFNTKVGISIARNGSVRVYDPTYTNADDFKSAMSGVYLFYELAAPTETSFTTASLVTENAEIPLSNEDGVLIGKCTEQLSENPGFIDAKIKLSDSDGTCYSNKLQLHVERSSQ